jgi:hypothetical protein
MSQNRKSVPLEFPKRFLQVGFLLFLVGTLGLIVNIILMMDSIGFDRALNMYTILSNHRAWVPEMGVPILGWLFQYLSVTGTAICAIILVIRVVEFRGLGEHTLFDDLDL